MTEVHSVPSTGGPSRDEKDAAPAFSLAEWLCLAATPTFAIMALLTGLDGSPMDRLCSSGHGPLSGMVIMYLLMSAFHAPPWLHLIRGSPSSQNPSRVSGRSSRRGRKAAGWLKHLQPKPV